MKIEREEPKFIPFKIVIESLEEAKFIYHKFRCSASISLREHCKKRGLPENRYAELDAHFWDALQHFVPDEVKK